MTENFYFPTPYQWTWSEIKGSSGLIFRMYDVMSFSKSEISFWWCQNQWFFQMQRSKIELIYRMLIYKSVLPMLLWKTRYPRIMTHINIARTYLPKAIFMNQILCLEQLFSNTESFDFLLTSRKELSFRYFWPKTLT